MPYDWQVIDSDVQILRGLLKRKREIAQDPVKEERRRLWVSHVSLDSQRPMILAETQGLLNELVPHSALQCQTTWAWALERELRELEFRCEHVRDDYVMEPRITYPWFVTIGDFGV